MDVGKRDYVRYLTGRPRDWTIVTAPATSWTCCAANSETRAAAVGLTLCDDLSRELRDLLQHAFTDIASVELVQ
jgi:hypothetical protein